MIVLAEADELCYRCASACEKQAYIVRTNKGEWDYKNQYTKTEIVKYLKDTKNKELDVDYTLEGYKLIDRPENVEHTLAGMIKALFQIKHPKLDKITHVKLYLSPSNNSNFRHKIVNLMGPKGLGYKAGRGERPHYYQLTRDLLINKYKAEEIEGYEADDALGLYASKDTILSHRDKDMNAIEGWHYNHVTGAIYHIPEGLGTIELIDGEVRGRGLIWFYAQMLTGDAIDNIPGCRNIRKQHHKKVPIVSDKEAKDILKGCMTEQDAFNVVASFFVYTYGDMWFTALKECADLLWICRNEGETGSCYLQNKGFIQ